MFDLFERFNRKIKNPTGCWEWKGVLKKGNSGQGGGYGCLSVDGITKYAHRISYEIFRGFIPEGLQIDHLCRNRKCVNPLHLEVVTQKENLLRGESIPAKNSRKKFCKRGHIFDEKNTYKIKTRNDRQCYICKNMRLKRWREKGKII